MKNPAEMVVVSTIYAYSMHDEKMGAFARPFFLTSHAGAIRAFADVCQDEKTVVAKHPTDFKLYFLGEFEEGTGKFKNLDVPVLLASGYEFAKSKAETEHVER